ncbi:MAG: phosphodiester glycosidase family protein [Clostridia bacterium]|nr:phosphodiester glycosidase family protein [Clostridia bacterium]MBQ5769573.1 phosphodiester glycosidase family protein [Clostridia bacterium]
MGGQSKSEKKRQDKILRRRWRRGAFGHFLGFIFKLILTLVIALVLGLHVMFCGPSPTIRDILTMSVTESSALKFVPYLFMTPDAVHEIIERCALVEPDEDTDTSLIQIKANAPVSGDENGEAAEEKKEEPIQLYPVKGATFCGYMMVVQDPSRVFVGVASDDFRSVGLTIDKIAERYGAVGGINANGFDDPNGSGDGGKPIGTVVSNGKIMKVDPNYTAAGFDQNHILHVGKFTEEKLEELGIRDAAAWGPALVVNGEAAQVSDTQTGLNPRSAIGQRADGAVLMLFIDGRHANSLGASYSDIINIMLKYGAVNACNLDGGYSAIMYLNGERVSDILDLEQSRSMPSAFLIRGE